MANPPLLARAAASRPVCHTDRGGRSGLSLQPDPVPCSVPPRAPLSASCPRPLAPTRTIPSTSEAAAASASGLGLRAAGAGLWPRAPAEGAGRERGRLAAASFRSRVPPGRPWRRSPFRPKPGPLGGRLVPNVHANSPSSPQAFGAEGHLTPAGPPLPAPQPVGGWLPLAAPPEPKQNPVQWELSLEMTR